MAKFMDKYRQWKNENPEKATVLEFLGGATALAVTAGVTGYCLGRCSGWADGYTKGIDVNAECGKVAAGIEGYREGYMAGYPIGYYNGSSRVLAVVNKDKRDDEWITPFPELFDHPADYLEMIVSEEGQRELHDTARRLCDAGINPDNMYQYDKGFNAYYQEIMDGDIQEFLNNHQELIQRKAEERLKENSFETLEI